MLTVTQAAHELNISPSRVRKLIADGKINAEKTGSAWTIPESEVTLRKESSPSAGRPKSSVAKPLQATKCVNLHNVYMELKSGNYSRPSASTLSMMKDKEEIGFVLCVYDYFLNIKQREEIEAGVF